MSLNNNKQKTSHELYKFIIVGLNSTVLHYAVLVICVEIIGVSVLKGTMIGYVFGALVNYLLNLRYTFRSNRVHRSAVPRFIFMVAAGFVINAFIMYALDFIPYLISQIVATGVVFMWNFIIGKYWTFADSKERES